jgi:hypothetical protein
MVSGKTTIHCNKAARTLAKTAPKAARVIRTVCLFLHFHFLILLLYE